jgi:hypothetical protein
MPSDGTIGGLVGKLDVLRIECPMCGRQGRYHVARLSRNSGRITVHDHVVIAKNGHASFKALGLI